MVPQQLNCPKPKLEAEKGCFGGLKELEKTEVELEKKDQTLQEEARLRLASEGPKSLLQDSWFFLGTRGPTRRSHSGMPECPWGP